VHGYGRRVRLSTALLLIVSLSTCTADPPSAVDADRLPENKRTSLGLYVNAHGAYAMLEARPHARLIDVRTPEEYVFVGHPPMAVNVPLVFYDGWNADEASMRLRANAEFVTEVRARVAPGETVLVMCRSGSRSALAAKALAEAGFSNVYNVIDGFEGDLRKTPGTKDSGRRSLNGWKNAGLPWTYDIDPNLVYRGSAHPQR
jgi:rhodanese-related sulfurtransferase